MEKSPFRRVYAPLVGARRCRACPGPAGVEDQRVDRIAVLVDEVAIGQRRVVVQVDLVALERAAQEDPVGDGHAEVHAQAHGLHAVVAVVVVPRLGDAVVRRGGGLMPSW